MNSRRHFIQSAALSGGLASTATLVQSPQILAAEPELASPYTDQLKTLPRGTRLLFQGDSITDMKWGRNQADRNHFLGHSYVYLIAARLGVDLPSKRFEFLNRGHSGNTVADLRGRWEADALDIRPDVLSVLIGINDVGRTIRSGKSHVPLDQWEADYRAILDASISGNASLKIVLLDPFMLPADRFADSEYLQWQTEAGKLREIVQRLAAEYSATHVRTQDVFNRAVKHAAPEHWIWDGVHPLPQGHELIARQWVRQFGETAAASSESQ